VRRAYFDAETGDPVERDDQVRGYEEAPGSFVVLTPKEIAAAAPESDKTLTVEAFVPCDEIDTTYFDKPYFVAPAGHSDAPFAVLRRAMEAEKVAALARGVLLRRVRSMLLRPQGERMVGNTLNFDYEVRPAEEAFADIPDLEVKGEMLELAKHIIKTKAGRFDPADFDDRYDTALVELVRAKAEGRKIEAPKRRAPEKVVDLMEALRRSAAEGKPQAARTKPKAKPKRPQARKAG
jgi:DNA end-binding protein Ku